MGVYREFAQALAPLEVRFTSARNRQPVCDPLRIVFTPASEASQVTIPSLLELK